MPRYICPICKQERFSERVRSKCGRCIRKEREQSKDPRGASE